MKNIIIPTMYKGYKFRSRLEARWAVFFDSLGMEWEYEKEGYSLGEGIYYLPDFWLPQVQMWAEVKPEEFNEEELKKIILLTKQTGFEILQLIGTPRFKTYDAFAADNDLSYPINPDIHLTEYCLSNYHNYPKEEGRFYCFPGGPLEEFDENFTDTKKAVIAARSARFEFGDKHNGI